MQDSPRIGDSRIHKRSIENSALACKVRQLSTAAYHVKELRQIDRRTGISSCTIECQVRELLLNAVVEQLVRGWIKGALGFAQYETASVSVLEVHGKESGILAALGQTRLGDDTDMPC